MGLVWGVIPCASSHWWRRVSLLRRFFPFLVGTVQEVLAVSLMRRGESSHALVIPSLGIILGIIPLIGIIPIDQGIIPNYIHRYYT